MSITFRYKTIKRPDGTTTKGPWIPITLIGPKNSLDTIALIDSGADFSVIPREFGEIMGVDFTRGEREKTKGVGGEVDTLRTAINVNIVRGHESYTFTLPIHIMLKEKTDVPPLIGRAKFFDEFKITFDQHNEKIILQKITPHRY